MRALSFPGETGFYFTGVRRQNIIGIDRGLGIWMHKGHCRPTTPPAMMQRCYGEGIEAERDGGDFTGSPGRKHGPARSSGRSVFEFPPDCQLKQNRPRLIARSMPDSPLRRNRLLLGAWSMPDRPLRQNRPRLIARSHCLSRAGRYPPSPLR